jgi:hypothetical protein
MQLRRFRIAFVTVWILAVALADVISIKTEDVTNPLRVRVRSIVIESREGNRVGVDEGSLEAESNSSVQPTSGLRHSLVFLAVCSSQNFNK